MPKRQRMATKETTPRNVCVYSHSPCVDGLFAALMAQLAMEGSCDNFRHYGVNYSDAWPDPKYSNSIVFMLDITPNPEVLARIAGLSEKVVILDHHKTAMDMYPDNANVPKNVELILDSSQSGAWLSLWYFSEPENNWNDYSFGPDIRRRVLLVQDFDLWKFELGDDTRYFNAGINLLFSSGKSFIRSVEASLAISTPIDDIIKAGRGMEEYRNLLMEEALACTGCMLHVPTASGPKVEVMASYKCGVQDNSSFAQFIADKTGCERTAVVTPLWTKKRVSISIRSQKHDVRTEIAEFHDPSGGGHEHACGFTVDFDTYQSWRVAE